MSIIEKNFGVIGNTSSVVGSGSGVVSGDMLKSAYDTNNSGVVDNSEALNGLADTAFQKIADLVDTATSSSTVLAPTARALKSVKDYADGLGTLISVADTTARDALTGLNVLDLVHVVDDNSPAGQWRRYQITAVTDGAWGTSTKIVQSQESMFASAIFVSADANNDITAGVDGGSYLDVSANATVSACNTHLTNNGSDHSYIDQSVTTIASPTFGGLSLTGNIAINKTTATNEISVGGNAISTSDCRINIGEGRTGNGNSYIDLVGDTTYTDYGMRLIRNNTGANASSEITHRGTGSLLLNGVEACSIKLRTSNTDQIIIDSAGRMGINRTPTTYPLEITGGLASYDNSVTSIFRSHPSNVACEVGTLSAAGFSVITNSTEKVYVDPSGNVTFTAYGAGTLTTDANGAITASSDERLKDIRYWYEGGIDVNSKLKPIAYNWKESTGYDTENINIGFSANNVQTAIPEAVGIGADGMLTLQDRPIIAVHTNAINELVDIINSQKEIIEDLKIRVSNLESK